MVRVLPTLAAAAAFLAPVLAQDFKLYGINYNIRAGPDAAPPAEKCKNATQIEKELQILKGVTDIVRIYSLVDCDQATAAVPAIINAGLKLELGLWVGPNNDVYAAEREKFKELVKNTALVNSSTVVSIHVGSEAIYREDVNASTAIANLHEIKQIAADAKLTVPVSIGDIGDSYLAYPDLFKEVDFVSANLFPFWEKVEADKAADHFYERYQKVATEAAKYNKTVVIGETGWPTNGTHAGASKASPENAATFFSDFYTLAKEHDIKYYYFAGFDEAWKLHNEAADSTVEGYFGIFTADGVLKPEFAELKLDSDDSSDADDAEEAGETEDPAEDEADEEEEDEEEDDNTLPPKTKPPVKKLHVKVKFSKHH